MALVRKCDRCGCEMNDIVIVPADNCIVERYHISRRRTSSTGVSFTLNVDLCKSCLMEADAHIRQFMERTTINIDTNSIAESVSDKDMYEYKKPQKRRRWWTRYDD